MPRENPFFHHSWLSQSLFQILPCLWQIVNYLMQKQLFLIIPDNAEGWNFYWLMHESAFFSPSNLQLGVTRHQILVWRKECIGLAPATQANEANVKKQAGIHSNLDLAIDKGTGRVWIPSSSRDKRTGKWSATAAQHPRKGHTQDSSNTGCQIWR